jgi:hypothetical protein
MFFSELNLGPFLFQFVLLFKHTESNYFKPSETNPIIGLDRL